jgi:hypothetical protein
MTRKFHSLSIFLLLIYNNQSAICGRFLALWHSVHPTLIHFGSMSSSLQTQVLEQARVEMSEILLRLQEMQHVSNALRVPQAHLSICAHLSVQIQSRKQQTQRVLAASAELRSVLKSFLSADGELDAALSVAAAHRSSIEDVCTRLHEALASIQESSTLGASAQTALAHDLSHHSHQHASADASVSFMPSAELPLTLQGQLEALLQLPLSVLDKLPS